MTETKILTLLSHDKWLDVADYRLSTHTIENIRHVDNPEDLKFLEIGRYGTVGSEKNCRKPRQIFPCTCRRIRARCSIRTLQLRCPVDST